MLLNHSYAALLASFRRDPSMLFRRVHVRVSKNVQIYSTTRRNTISWSIWRVARVSLEENSNLQMGTELSRRDESFQRAERQNGSVQVVEAVDVV
jgi:hypothetical protein